MIKIYQILYQTGGDINNPQEYFKYKLAEIGARNHREAKQIFKRHHAPENKIIKVVIKRIEQKRRNEA